ncbi:MAG TPA: hypothetical protein VGP03_00370 [Pseudonocardiaceae bacterium]|nr:hypothetical protein [Pseudonocardiaceae bacterium]
MGQLSFYSAEARQPGVADLAGLLCGPGQAVSFARGTAARLSVVLHEQWRAKALSLACAERGVEAQVLATEEGHPLVRTAFRTDLSGLAARWLRGAVKGVPREFDLDGSVLRLWALSAGKWVESGYVLGLDPHAPDTHEPLHAALAASGLPSTLLGVRGGGPALRVTGRRRLARLAELVGSPPRGVAEDTWPAA